MIQKDKISIFEEISGKKYKSFEIDKCFKDVSEDTLKRLEQLFHYCYNNNIDVRKYRPDFDELTSDYKPFEWMYDTKTYESDLHRFIIVSSYQSTLNSKWVEMLS